MPKLTKNYIDKITAPADKEAFHWDSEVKGFGLRVTPTGKITYIVQGRVNGKTVRLTIGPHGRWTPETARNGENGKGGARELLRMMDMGIDPRAVAKKEAAQRVTLRDVADAYKRDRPLKDSSKAEIERHVTTTFEAWLKKPLRDINREMVTKRFNDIKNKGTRGDGPAPAQANQSMAVLRALFNYAIREYREPDGSPVL
ncbi:MAG: Arm DNA-binding domain-containing protein, partial [Diaphorobacter sp.]|nr:Arm DNA-binding domain-containing protein [Diaphorobacter sp.]